MGKASSHSVAALEDRIVAIIPPPRHTPWRPYVFGEDGEPHESQCRSMRRALYGSLRLGGFSEVRTPTTYPSPLLAESFASTPGGWSSRLGASGRVVTAQKWHCGHEYASGLRGQQLIDQWVSHFPPPGRGCEPKGEASQHSVRGSVGAECLGAGCFWPSAGLGWPSAPHPPPSPTLAGGWAGRARWVCEQLWVGMQGGA